MKPRQLRYLNQDSLVYKRGKILSGNGVTLDSILNCVSCPRAKKAGPPVRPAGSFDSSFIIKGACPGRQEVEEGIPFNPKAPGGNVLISYFKALGIDRSDCFITNSCFCLDLDKFNKDRLPTADEEDICATWKVLEWFSFTQPKYLILLGKNAIRQSFGESFPSPTKNRIITQVKIPWLNYPIHTLTIPHPGWILRRPSEWDGVKEALIHFRGVINGIES